MRSGLSSGYGVWVESWVCGLGMRSGYEVWAESCMGTRSGWSPECEASVCMACACFSSAASFMTMIT